MTTVKCKYCGKDVDRKEAIVVPNGKGKGRNAYYCCELHSHMENDRDGFYRKAMEIFGVTTNSVFFKEFDHLGKVHTFKKLTEYMTDNEDELREIISRPFDREYNKIRYFSTIVGNNIADYKMRKLKERIEKPKQETDLHEVKTEPLKKKKKTGLDDLLGDLLDG